MPFEIAPDPIQTLGDTLVNEIPEPQTHAIEQARIDAAREAENVSGAAPSSVELDALGIPWDPAQHATGKDGKGVRTATGSWRKRRGLAGSRSHLDTGAAKTKTAEQSPEEKAALDKQTLEKQNRMAGAMAAAMLINVSTAVGGEEFQPKIIHIPGGIQYNEKDFLTEAFGDYFVAKGISDLPPGMVLLSALSMYYLPRFREPKVKEKGSKFMKRVRSAGEWVYFKFKYRGKKAPAKDKRIKDDGVFPDADNVHTIQNSPSIPDV